MSVETLFSAPSLLWLVISVFAVAILFGSINRRRSRLTETLRDYVDRHETLGKESPSERDPPGDRDQPSEN